MSTDAGSELATPLPHARQRILFTARPHARLRILLIDWLANQVGPAKQAGIVSQHELLHALPSSCQSRPFVPS